MTLTLTVRSVTVTLAEDAITFPDVMRVEQTEVGQLRLYGTDGELMAEFAPPPAGWRAWRWMPTNRHLIDESKKPGQVLVDLGAGYQPVPPHVPLEARNET